MLGCKYENNEVVPSAFVESASLLRLASKLSDAVASAATALDVSAFVVSAAFLFISATISFTAEILRAISENSVVSQNAKSALP